MKQKFMSIVLALGSTAATIASAPLVWATNDEANGIYSWYNLDWPDMPNHVHTTIVVHGRSDKNHGKTLTYDWPHYCDSPGLSADQKYRCRMRIDVRNHWGVSGYRGAVLPGDPRPGFYGTDYYLENEALGIAIADDFRNLGGSVDLAVISLSPLRLAAPPASGGGISVTRPGVEYPRIVAGSPYHPALGDALHEIDPRADGVVADGLFGNYHDDYLRDVVFVGYDGESDPISGEPGSGVMELDSAMWNYCASTDFSKSCTILCHSAGCLLTGYYLAQGWGPGNDIHQMSGLIDVYSISSAAGGSIMADWSYRGGAVLPDDWVQFTPMVNRLRTDVAMGSYTHGQQLGGYAGVPTYYVAANTPGCCYAGHDTDEFWDSFSPGNDTTPNDGAVSSRSQCGASGTWEVGHEGRSCRFIEENGMQYASTWYNFMETYLSYYGQYPAGYDYDVAKHMLNGDHSTTKRNAVRLMTALF